MPKKSTPKNTAQNTTKDPKKQQNPNWILIISVVLIVVAILLWILLVQQKNEENRKEMERKEIERKEIERKEIERKEIERKEKKRKEKKRKKNERKQLRDFSSIKDGLTPLIDLMETGSYSVKFKSARAVLKSHPTHIPTLYHLAFSAFGLLDFELSFETYKRIHEYIPNNRIIQKKLNEANEYLQKTIQRTKEIEEEMKTYPDSKFFYRWKSIEPLSENLLNYKSNLDEIKEITFGLKHNRTKFDMFKRLWAVETGRVENIYDITESSTKSLIIYGISASAISERQPKTIEPETNIAWEYEQIMLNQLSVLNNLYNGIKYQNLTLNSSLLFDLHNIFTERACFMDTYLPTGEQIRVLIRRGKYKIVPNAASRMDGLIHEYAPVSKVQEEMEKLFTLYHEYKKKKVSPEVLSAWLHHRFVQIHPFQDGNGRVARSIASIDLIESGMMPFVVTFDDRGKYIETLKHADNGNLIPLIEFIVFQQKNALSKVSMF